MRTRRQHARWATRGLLCLLALAVSGCTALDDTLVQALQGIWFVVSLAIALLIVAFLRGRAWLAGLAEWEPPNPPKPKAKGWTPMLVVGLILLWFVVYNFVSDLAMPPEQRWWNAGAWVVGSIVGAFAGWFAGRWAGRREFRRRHPGQSSTGPA